MAGELRVYRHEGGYAVFDADRMQVSRVYACQQSAIGMATRIEKKARQKMRPCLRCGSTFKSEGPHNRMCDPCRDPGRLPRMMVEDQGLEGLR